MTDHYLKKELYEALKKDSALFDFLEAGALDGIWYWDLESPENEWMSPRFWELMGYDPLKKKDLASEWRDLIFPEDLKVVIENFEKHSADESHPYDQVVRYKHKDGSTVWVHCRGMAIRDKKGKPIRMLGTHNNITAFKQVELELSETEGELQQVESELEKKAAYLDRVIETSAVSTWIADENGTAIHTNPACLKFFGTTEEEVIGKYNLFKDEVIMKNGLMPEIRRVFEKKVTANVMIDYDFGAVGHIDVANPTHKIVNSIFTPILDKQGRLTNVIAQAFDLTEIKKNEEALRLEKERLYNIGDNLPGGQIFQLMILPDGTRKFTHVSSQVEHLYECSISDALKDSGNIYNKIPKEDNIRILQASDKAVKDGSIFDEEFRVRLNSGEIRWHRSIGKVRLLENGSAFFDGIDLDITDQKLAGHEKEVLLEELKEKNIQLEHAATHDFLTGLPNRVLLYDRFLQNVSLCKRNGLKMGVCIADTDSFKVINDTYGHPAGDLVLKEISSRLKSSLREYDTTSRVGGDEFSLLLINISEKEEIVTIINRALKQVNRPMSVEKQTVTLSLSIGIAIYPDDGSTPVELLKKADQAMYEAKREGGNQCRIFKN